MSHNQRARHWYESRCDLWDLVNILSESWSFQVKGVTYKADLSRYMDNFAVDIRNFPRKNWSAHIGDGKSTDATDGPTASLVHQHHEQRQVYSWVWDTARARAGRNLGANTVSAWLEGFGRCVNNIKSMAVHYQQTSTTPSTSPPPHQHVAIDAVSQNRIDLASSRFFLVLDLASAPRMD